MIAHENAPLRKVRVHYGVSIPGLGGDIRAPESAVCLLEEGYTTEADVPTMIAVRRGIPVKAIHVERIEDV
jgi:hypothetical protein